MVLSDHSLQELEDLVCQCIAYLRDRRSICLYEGKKSGIPYVSGNLYALHVRYPNGNCKFKYIGVSDNIEDRVKQHLQKNYKTTQSKRAKVKNELKKGNTIGVSSIRVEAPDARIAKALSKYIESRVIDWLWDERQMKEFGEPWNKRKG